VSSETELITGAARSTLAFEVAVTVMHGTTDESADGSAQAAAMDFAGRVARVWQALLGPEFLGAYLIGSLAHGGFSRCYSDVDIALVTERGLPQSTLDEIRNRATALSAGWGPKLSIFWADRHFSVGRFPPLDRIDYLDHGVVLLQRERVWPVRPHLQEIRGYLADAPFAKWTDEARRFATAEILETKDRKAYLRTLLYPARFCYSWKTGRMGSNDDAVAFLHEMRPARLDIRLIDRALECRRADADPDPLFPARASLPSQVDACATLLAQHASPRLNAATGLSSDG
jgi:predicted nucleotidyltransferase